MKKPIVLFGHGKIAEVLLYYWETSSDRDVAAITVDQEFIEGKEWKGLPLVPFESVEQSYPPAEYDFFVALGYQDLNELRASKVAATREKGYQLVSFVPPGCEVPSTVTIGENCFIMPQALIHPNVTIGHNVFVWSGAMIGHHSVIGDHCWFTSCANISGNVTVGESCFFAVNSTVGHGVTLGKKCFLGANSLVTKCTGDEEVFLEASTAKFRLDSKQFLTLSKFDDL